MAASTSLIMQNQKFSLEKNTTTHFTKLRENYSMKILFIFPPLKTYANELKLQKYRE